MRIGKFLYFGDFVVIPIAVLWLGAAAYMAGGGGAIPEWSLSLLFGAALWTLIEYLIHRYAYHQAPILTPLHDAHHQAPRAGGRLYGLHRDGVVLIAYGIGLALHRFPGLVLTGRLR